MHKSADVTGLLQVQIRAGNNGPNGVNNFAQPQRGSNRQNTGPTMTIRAYFQNLLNTVQYGNYVGTMTSPFFGHAISTARPAPDRAWVAV